jgi:hypothetical protein
MKSSTWEPFVLQIADQILQQRMRFYDQVALHPARIPLPRIWCPNRFPATMGNDDSTPISGRLVHTVRKERFLGIIDQNPSVSKSNRLHVVIVRFFFMNLT